MVLKLDKMHLNKERCVHNTLDVLTCDICVVTLYTYATIFKYPFTWLFHMLLYFVRNDELKMNNGRKIENITKFKHDIYMTTT